MSNNLDPDQDRCSVGPDLGPNCLQKLAADDISRQRVNLLLKLESKQIVPDQIAWMLEAVLIVIWDYFVCTCSSCLTDLVKC